MQATHSSLRWLTVVFPVILALALLPAASAAPLAVTSLSPNSAPAPTASHEVSTLGRVSSAVVLVSNPPLPAITSLSPASAVAGSTAFTLIVNGANFTATSTLRWGATALTTVHKSATQLTASVPAILIAAAGKVNVTVLTVNRVSTSVAFTVNPPLPVITSLNPASAIAGNAFTLTINGANFTAAASSKLGTTALATTYKSAAQLTAVVPASLVASAGTAAVTVTTAGGTSPQAVLTINPPLPTITSLSPASAVVGGAAFTLTINGTNFTSSATSKWGATPLTTTYVSTTKLTAAVPASLISSTGSASVTVSTVVGTSSGATFTINPPLPTIAGLSPNSVVAQTGAFTLTVNGANFLSGAGETQVRWNGTTLTTTYVSSTQLTAAIPAGLVNGPGTANVSVVTASETSASVPFTINPAPPTITSVAPYRIFAGFGAFTLTVYGTNFTSTATVDFGTTPLVVTESKSNMLAVSVPASLIVTAATVGVIVTTAGGTSAPANFTIEPPQPTITSVSPNPVAAGGAQFTLTINGTGFTLGAFATLGATRLTTTLVSATQLTATVPASLIATAAESSIMVYVGGGGWSAATAFAINPAPPTITSLSPASATAGSAGFMLTIAGTAFTPAATSMWGTTSLGTIYVSPTQLTASVPASLVVNTGTAGITVTTAAGTSAPATFTISPAPPIIGSLSPGLATAGGAAFTLTVSGVNFTSAATAKWGSTALTTTYISASELTAAIPANLIATAGSAKITVTTAAGTSSPVTFIVNPAPKITTSTLPSGTVNNAYSGPINVTGGVPGYSWTVTGLPNSMSYFNTSDSTLTITGTPASSGTITFQVSVADTTGATAGPVTFSIKVAAGPNGANNGNLNGSYVCLFKGFIDDDSSRWASVSSFQADGHGNFTSGIFDTNSRDIGSASGLISGSYNIGADNNGLAFIHTVLTDGAAGIQTTQWALALTSAAQPAAEFQLVETDDLGELPSGQQGTANCYLAAPSAFAAGTISGKSFAFGLDGEDGDGALKAAAGYFSASAGKIASGNIDVAQGGNATVQTASFTGTYTAPDPISGRFTIALKAGGNPSGLTVYIIDSSRMFMLDNTWGDGEQAGNVRTQQQASYSGANIDGPFVLYMRGAEFNNASSSNPSGFYSDLFQGDGDGNGNLTINQSYTDDDGTYSASNSTGGPTALSFDSAHPGRATFQLGSDTAYLYLFNNSTAFEMRVKENGSLDSGWFEPQTQTTFTDAALAGNYVLGELPLLNGSSSGNVGEFVLSGSGAINGSTTAAGEENLSWDQSISMIYSWDTTAPGTGTFLVANGTQQAASCAVISSTKFVCTLQADPAPSIEVMQQ